MYRKHVSSIGKYEPTFPEHMKTSLWEKIEFEYSKSLMNNRYRDSSVDKDLKVIRIFISSTFKDFYNERDVLVRSVFPKLRKWCEEQGLFLVECDLRWGVPVDATNLEAVSYCLDEIEKSREETNNHNFFLCLIGERFGWVPSEETLLEKLKQKYDFIKDSSVTLMEIVHGVLRSGTENSLFMIRSKNILENMPKSHLKYFEESDELLKINVDKQKNFIKNHFSKSGSVKDYSIHYESTVVDPVSGKERIVFSDFDEFSKIVEEYFKSQILDFKVKHKLSPTMEDQNEDMIHKSHLISINKSSLKRTSYIELLRNQIINSSSDSEKNPVIIITGEAGSGKSTIVAHIIEYYLNIENENIFYHFCGASNTSHSQLSILKRLENYLKLVFDLDIKNSDEENSNLSKSLEKISVPKFKIFIDAVDELWDLDIGKQFPKFTSKNIQLIISCLCDTSIDSFYSKFMTQEIYKFQLPIEKMDKIQLIDITNKYLHNFGKNLDSEQLEKLLSFENSHNPLWLLSACEELRMHGDYSSLTKLIISLPPSIVDLNRMIIKRLSDQDVTNVLKTVLQLLVISRAGIWESLIKDILAEVLNFSEPISHSTWSDIMWQLKGFLLIQSIPLPLIKIRHRVMKESIEEELSMDEEYKISLHHKISIYLEKVYDNAGDVFLSDYMYHLVKSNARNRMIDFMRNRKSWKVLKQPFVRSRIMLSTRCINPKSADKQSALMMCIRCANKSGDLSIFSINRNSCFYCGNFVANANTDQNKLFPCQFHKNLNPQIGNCSLCNAIVPAKQGEHVKVCQMCSSNNPMNCGVIVSEKDILYRQQLGFSKAVYRIESII